MEPIHLPTYMLQRKVELRHLRYFVAVSESGSFRAAADRIHVTQAAITRQIHDLEALVEARLLQRTAIGVYLTPAGEAFLGKVNTPIAVATRVVWGQQFC